MQWQRGHARHSRYWADEDASGKLKVEASKDTDRILYSTAFRRLGGVTQVVASNELGLYHNRLTHTLKTAQVGSRIANSLRGAYLAADGATERERARWREVIDGAGGLEPRVVRAACMAHDLGHPPFGHIGEDELQILTSSQPNKTTGKRATAHRLDRHTAVPTGYQLPDSFEGNAQSLRIVTKLAFRSPAKEDGLECPALNLTKATLTALMKYPWSYGTRPADVRSANELKKWGYYDCETTIARWAFDDRDYPEGVLAPASVGRAGVGVEQREYRSLEAQVMDWADDISYAVHDAEDFFRAGIIPLDVLANSDAEWEAFFRYAWSRSKGVGEKFGPGRESEITEMIMPLRRSLFPRTPYVGSRADRETLHNFASTLIKQATAGTALDPLTGMLSINPEQVARIEVLKQLTWYYVIDRPSLESVQRGQRYVIRSLFRDLIGWVEEKWAGPDDAVRPGPGSGERRHLPARLLDYLDISFSPDEATGAPSYNESQRISRAVVDYIVSLTEPQAIELCSRLTGRSARSMLDGWVYG